MGGCLAVSLVLLLGAWPEAESKVVSSGLQAALRSRKTLESWLEKLSSVDRAETLSMPDKNGRQLAHYAAEAGHVKALELLVEKGVDVWPHKQGAATPLALACNTGQAEALLYLVTEPALKTRRAGYMDARMAVNQMDGNGSTCLHLAASAGHADLLLAAVAEGAILELQNKEGFPLHCAASGGHKSVVTQLLNMGEDPCAKNAARKKPRRLSSKKEVVELLEKKEKDRGCLKGKGGAKSKDSGKEL